MSATYFVGQTLYLDGVNRHGRDRERVEVVKVGRKLMSVADRHGRTTEYRMEDGRRNDAYRHSWVQTADEVGATERRAVVMSRLHAMRLYDMGLQGFSLEALTAVADLLEADLGSKP